MSTSRISTHFFVLTAVFVIAGSLVAQVNPVTPPPSATAGIYPLSDVHRGLHGVAYTVFEGTQPEAMDVEILGVLKNVLGPDQDMILARLHGSKPEYTGVVAGMSGSPVYIDGKLLGALSYRIGQFSKEPIAGITPIAEMLAVNGTAEPEVLRAGSGPMWKAGLLQRGNGDRRRHRHPSHRNSAYPLRLQPGSRQVFPGARFGDGAYPGCRPGRQRS